MDYTDFYKLSWKQFRRSPNFVKNQIAKILSFVGYFFLFLYLLAIPFIVYFAVKEDSPDADVVLAVNKNIYFFFFLVFFLLMYVSFDGMRVKSFMLLPIKKSKIIHFHILKSFIHPVNLSIFLMLLTFAGILIYHDYDVVKVIFWALSLLLLAYIINLLLLLSEKNQFLSSIMTILFFVIMLKRSLIVPYFAPLGKLFQYLYEHPVWVLVPFALLLLTYFVMYRYIITRFYLDDGIKVKKKKVTDINISFLDRYGIVGKFILNDIRLIWRNAQPRQMLFGVIIIFAYALFMFSPYFHKLHQAVFNKILFTIFLTGYFVFTFGSRVPAWDSEYYKLMMTQNLNYRKFLEAKWWMLTFTVLVMTLISTVFLIFGIKAYLLILAMAIFNIGINIPTVLLTGLFNTTPVKLNQKVKAFQNNNKFKFKTFVYGILRLIVPIVLYLAVEHYWGFRYGVGLFITLGLLGLVFKNKFLDWISKQYIKQKYATIEAFSKAEDN